MCQRWVKAWFHLHELELYLLGAAWRLQLEQMGPNIKELSYLD